MIKRICSVERCEEIATRRGWCRKHYRRWQIYGDPNREPPTFEKRFWAKVNKTDSCWLWTGALDFAGYGRFNMSGGMKSAHRLAYEWLVGPIPEGLQLDHLCRVTNCVRPSHLDPVTARENGRRGVKGVLTTHCPIGHPYNEENTRITPRGWRICRTCHRDRKREQRRPHRG
jgi:hypothetical protein